MEFADFDNFYLLPSLTYTIYTSESCIAYNFVCWIATNTHTLSHIEVINIKWQLFNLTRILKRRYTMHFSYLRSSLHFCYVEFCHAILFRFFMLRWEREDHSSIYIYIYIYIIFLGPNGLKLNYITVSYINR